MSEPMAGIGGILVSTHSRPKAAGNHIAPRKGRRKFQHTAARRRLGPNPPTPLRGAGFNTQPPEGGWVDKRIPRLGKNCFNTQPPEGGWKVQALRQLGIDVSTHSRPKAAGARRSLKPRRAACFNTQPPEGGWGSTRRLLTIFQTFQHTAARRRLASSKCRRLYPKGFQHTAARRRLVKRWQRFPNSH